MSPAPKEEATGATHKANEAPAKAVTVMVVDERGAVEKGVPDVVSIVAGAASMAGEKDIATATTGNNAKQAISETGKKAGKIAATKKGADMGDLPDDLIDPVGEIVPVKVKLPLPRT